MMAATPAARAPRAPHASTPTAAAATGDEAESDLQQHVVAVRSQLFDFRAEENAELLREHQALQQLLLAQLKGEDEILKKWMELI